MNRSCVAQLATAASTETTLIDGTQASPFVATVNVCNRDSGSTRIRVRLMRAGETADDKQYLEYDRGLDAQSSVILGPYSLLVGDILKVYEGNGAVSWTVFAE